jgi:hypothetical protein
MNRPLIKDAISIDFQRDQVDDITKEVELQNPENDEVKRASICNTHSEVCIDSRNKKNITKVADNTYIITIPKQSSIKAHQV